MADNYIVSNTPIDAEVYDVTIIKGDKGDTGDTGSTPDISIGTVTTLPAGSNATVSVSGTPEQPVMSFGIPKGDKGDTGDTGATGKSAYQDAVDNGYTGTQAQFGTYLANVASDLSEIENITATAATLPAGSNATASYSAGLISLGIPQGDKGDPGNVDMIADDFSTSTNYAIDDYAMHSGHLYRFTAAHAAGAWIGTDAVQVQLAEDVADLKSAITHYNISNYEGNSLNEKWDLMRADFNSWGYKHILIPMPTEDDPACIKVGNDVKWKVTAPIVFDDDCNCCDVEIYGELYAIGTLDQVILIDDADKPENINFINGIQIRANRHTGNTIGNAIEVRAGARINFFGQTIINDCDKGIVIGGANQSNASECSFDRVQIGFYDTNAIYVYGGTYVSNLFAKHIEIGVAQTQNTNAVEISNNTNGVMIGELIYGTDVSKDGYTAFDAGTIVNIIRQNKDTHNIMCNHVYATSADTVVKMDANSGALYDVHFGFLGTAKTNGTAIDAVGVSGLVVDEIKADNVINVRSCYNSRIGKSAISASDSIDRFVGLMPVVNIDGTTGINDTPSISNKSIGTITVVKNANGTRTYFNTGDANIPFDGQMFIPAISTLPTPAWNLRGKMYRVNNDSGTDTIAVCIRYNGSAYKWFDIISNTVL